MARMDQILEDFALLDDWEDRYRYVIELGRALEPLPEESRTEANKVPGCASQVWLETSVDRAGGEPKLHFRGDSDAHIVRGLVALMIALFSDRSAQSIAATDAGALLTKLGLREHLTPQRSNGLASMVGRIKRDAEAVLSGQQQAV